MPCCVSATSLRRLGKSLDFWRLALEWLKSSVIANFGIKIKQQYAPAHWDAWRWQEGSFQRVWLTQWSMPHPWRGERESPVAKGEATAAKVALRRSVDILYLTAQLINYSAKCTSQECQEYEWVSGNAVQWKTLWRDEHYRRYRVARGDYLYSYRSRSSWALI